jgi:hypothetical protein
MPTPSTAAQVIISIIPIVGIVMGCAVIFFYLLWNYKLKIHMIDKGIYTRVPFDIDTFSLLSGLVLFILGLALMIFFLVKDGFSYGVLSGLIPVSIGVSLLVFFIVRYKIKSRNAL